LVFLNFFFLFFFFLGVIDGGGIILFEGFGTFLSRTDALIVGLYFLIPTPVAVTVLVSLVLFLSLEPGFISVV